MQASYKRYEKHAKNPVEFALRCARIHIGMIHGILENYQGNNDKEVVNLNLELMELLDEAIDCLEEQGEIQ